MISAGTSIVTCFLLSVTKIVSYLAALHRAALERLATIVVREAFAKRYKKLIVCQFVRVADPAELWYLCHSSELAGHFCLVCR